MLSLKDAQPRDIESLRNWLDGSGSLARDETAYLSCDRELVSLAPSGDSAILHIEAWVEDRIMWFWKGFRKVHVNPDDGFRGPSQPFLRPRMLILSQSRFHDVSNNPDVYIYSGTLIKRMARTLLLSLITMLLLLPVIICNIIQTLLARIVVVMASTVSYLTILGALTQSRTMELTIAGAT
jgi:hypothetical protein